MTNSARWVCATERNKSSDFLGSTRGLLLFGWDRYRTPRWSLPALNVLLKHCTSLWFPSPEVKRFKARAAGCHICGRLRSWSLLCQFPTLPIPRCLCWIKRSAAVPLRTSRGVDLEVYGRDSLPASSWSALWLHCSGLAMTREGLLQAPSPSSPWDARISEEAAWVHSVDKWKQIWTESACWSVFEENAEGTLIYLTV